MPTGQQPILLPTLEVDKHCRSPVVVNPLYPARVWGFFTYLIKQYLSVRPTVLKNPYGRDSRGTSLSSASPPPYLVLRFEMVWKMAVIMR